MSDLTKNIYVKNFSYHLPIIKGGGAKTYLEKRENIFIKGGRCGQNDLYFPLENQYFGLAKPSSFSQIFKNIFFTKVNDSE